MKLRQDSSRDQSATAEDERVCRLCGESKRISSVPCADPRGYFLCDNCSLISVERRFLPSPEAARARYEQHNNTPENEGYVAFLGQAVKPMLDFIRPGMRGLDYGCGPGPALSGLVHKAGIQCDDFDPLFFPLKLSPPYDFIFCTETFEHFFEPRREIEQLAGMLSPGGYLGIMTGLWDSLERFRTWYYTRDLTHVSFYHVRTFEYICGEFGFEQALDDGRRVFVLRRIS